MLEREVLNGEVVVAVCLIPRLLLEIGTSLIEDEVSPRSEKDGHSGSKVWGSDFICLDECVSEMDEGVLLGSVSLSTGLPVPDVSLPVGDVDVHRLRGRGFL